MLNGYRVKAHLRRWMRLHRRMIFAAAVALTGVTFGHAALGLAPLIALTQLKWKRDSGTTSLMTTELNSLTTTGSAISSAIDNDASMWIFADIELSITYGTNPTANTLIECYIVRAIDGSNYEDGSTTGPVVPRSGLIGSFTLRATTSTQVMVIPMVTLPPGDFKVMVWSRTSGQTAAASGNTLKMIPYTQEAA